jgi:hypothetical protein
MQVIDNTVGIMWVVGGKSLGIGPKDRTLPDFEDVALRAYGKFA